MLLTNTTIIYLLVTFIVLLSVCAIIIFLFIRKKDRRDILKKLEDVGTKIRSDIKTSVAPNFINLSPNTDDFIQFAIEIWRLEQSVFKMDEAFSENQKKKFINSVEKMKRYLEKYDITIIDYTGQKFNDGLNLDILSGKINNESVIQETIEPTIMYRGQVIKKAKIILPSE